MGFYQLRSETDNFSYIIEKNPLTGLQLKNNRKGLFFYWFSNDNKTFNIYFKDSPEETSYKEHVDAQFEYLNSAQYNNARIILDVCSEILHSCREKDNLLDKEGINYTFFINLINTEFKTIDIFQRYFNTIGYNIEYTEKLPKNYSVSISSNGKKLRELINLVNLFAIFATLNSDDYYYLAEELIEKFLKIANYLDVPYFIKYLIKIRMIRDPFKFDRLKNKLNKSDKFKFEFKFGDSHEMRIKWVKDNLGVDREIIDVGAGIDFKYLKIFAPKLLEENKKYYAIDINELARNKIIRGAENRGLKNVSVFETIDELIEVVDTEKPMNILLTEVLEHNNLQDAYLLLIKILNQFNIDRLFVTVPNVEFNRFYNLEGFRHSDHKWEITYNEFKDFINNCLIVLNEKYSVEFHQIGDLVDGIPVTSGCIIKNKSFQE